MSALARGSRIFLRIGTFLAKTFGYDPSQLTVPMTHAILPIHRFDEIDTRFIAPDTLVLLDLDNTVFASASCYGSVEFFIHLVRDEIAKTGITREAACELVGPRWQRAQDHITTELTHPGVPIFMDYVRAQGAPLLALTARYPEVLPQTMDALASHGVAFDVFGELAFAKTYEPLSKPAPALLHEGVLFCHDRNEKGQVFGDFYTHFAQYRAQRGLAPITRVILVDDWEHNFAPMVRVMDKLGLGFHGYHFQYARNTFDLTRALEDEAHIYGRIASGQSL